MPKQGFTLENENLILKTRPRAGQMASLFDKRNGRELLYQGDQGWKDQNPTLFPIIGSTWKNGEYQIDGQTFKMKNHGLVRYADLDGTIQDGRITYVLDSDEETKKQYPFDFHFEMSYKLDGASVIVSYRIVNTSKKDLPFSFGLHPAFRTAQNPDEKFEDFSIRLDRPIDALQVIFHDDLSSVEKTPVDLTEWKLSRDDLKKFGTMVYEDPKAQNATLCYQGKPRMNVHFEGYPWLAFWSHPTFSDMICIEPWYGHSDYLKKEQPFEKREGTMLLRPGETFEASYRIDALD